jgi:hypothetical protein
MTQATRTEGGSKEVSSLAPDTSHSHHNEASIVSSVSSIDRYNSVSVMFARKLDVTKTVSQLVVREMAEA